MTATVEVVVPSLRRTDVRALLADMRASTRSQPFSEELVDFVAEFSKRLRRSARDTPELQALAYWMRRAEVMRLKAEFEALSSSNTRLVPRGLVFHVPPANVDTIFVYSWFLSLLVGNRNVIRLSSRASGAAELLVTLLRDLLAEARYERIARTNVIVRYDRDSSATAEISAEVDARMLWGGDQSVLAVRQHATPAHAIDYSFNDRFSLCAVSAATYTQLSDEARTRLCEQFFNDAYWFDQLGCSSPRLLLWVGDSRQVSQDFYSRLSQIIRRKRYAIDTGAKLNKMLHAYRSVLDHPVHSYNFYSNELVVLTMHHASDVRGEFCGAGLFYHVDGDSLSSLHDFVSRQDQTLTHFGFSASELESFVTALNGVGIDRIVPIGAALTFNRYWDGYDLLQALSRRVYLEA